MVGGGMWKKIKACTKIISNWRTLWKNLNTKLIRIHEHFESSRSLDQPAIETQMVSMLSPALNNFNTTLPCIRTCVLSHAKRFMSSCIWPHGKIEEIQWWWKLFSKNVSILTDFYKQSLWMLGWWDLSGNKTSSF